LGAAEKKKARSRLKRNHKKGKRCPKERKRKKISLTYVAKKKEIRAQEGVFSRTTSPGKDEPRMDCPPNKKGGTLSLEKHFLHNYSLKEKRGTVETGTPLRLAGEERGGCKAVGNRRKKKTERDPAS